MVDGVCGNDNWINSYLDAILDAGKAASSGGRGGGGGGGGGGEDRPSLLLCERGHFSPARYFVEEVITGYDETDLYKTWSRANAMRSTQERNTWLENMTWRIWNLARKKKEEMARRCYVMYIGRFPGVYEEWKDCQKQVNNFSGNNYQGYESREVAEEKWRRHGRKKWRNFLVITTLLLFMVGYVFYFI